MSVNNDTQDAQMDDVNHFTVPFVLEGDVPLDFIPICPTFEQLSECDKSIANMRSDHHIMTNLTVQAALEPLDHPAYNNTEFTNLQIENEIYGNGKLYFLCRLMTRIQQSKYLTDVQIAILTENPIIEKIMYYIFRYYFLYESVRISYIDQPGLKASTGYAFGVIVRLTSNKRLPINLNDCDMIFTYDGDVFPKKWNKHKAFLGYQSNPAILNLASMGSPDLRLKHYLSLSASFHHCSREILIFHHNSHMKDLFYGENERYSGTEFLVLNDLMAKQVVDWLFGPDQSDHFQFKYPIVNHNPLMNE